MISIRRLLEQPTEAPAEDRELVEATLRLRRLLQTEAREAMVEQEAATGATVGRLREGMRKVPGSANGRADRNSPAEPGVAEFVAAVRLQHPAARGSSRPDARRPNRCHHVLRGHRQHRRIVPPHQPADAYIVKPINREGFLDVVDRLCPAGVADQ